MRATRKKTRACEFRGRSTSLLRLGQAAFVDWCIERAEWEGWPSFRGEKETRAHSLVGIVEQSCGVLFPWASLGLSNRRKCHPFALRFYIKERVGCMIRRRHYK